MPKRKALSRPAFPKRTGFTAFEAIAAVAILVVLLAIAGQMSGAMLNHRRSVERHRMAMGAVANLMSIAMALPYDEITHDHLETLAAEFTPERAKWEIWVGADPREQAHDAESIVRRQYRSFQPRRAKRIAIALRFVNKAGRDAPSQPLVAWRYATDPQAAGAVDDARPNDTDAIRSGVAVPGPGEEE